MASPIAFGSPSLSLSGQDRQAAPTRPEAIVWKAAKPRSAAPPALTKARKSANTGSPGRATRARAKTRWSASSAARLIAQTAG